MKKMMVFILLLISLPYLCFAATSDSTGMNVTFDIPSLVSTAKVTFTNKAINRGFKAFEKIKESDKAPSIVLSVVNDAGVTRGMSTNLYVSYQIYSSDLIDIVIQPQGPLEEVNGNVKLNWQVYSVDNPALFAGSLADNTGETAYAENASFIVYSSKMSDIGLSGSKQLQVKTQDILSGEVGTYKANLTAIIKVR